MMISTFAPASSSCFLKLLGILLGDALLQSLRSALDESLGLGQTQAGDLADSLDDLDLGSSVETGEDDVELGLLLGSGGSSAGSGSSDSSGSGGNAELFFQSVDQLRQLQNGKSP